MGSFEKPTKRYWGDTKITKIQSNQYIQVYHKVNRTKYAPLEVHNKNHWFFGDIYEETVNEGYASHIEDTKKEKKKSYIAEKREQARKWK